MFLSVSAQQNRAYAAAGRPAAASCCAQASCTCSNDMLMIPDAAFAASIFIACLLGRITLSALLAVLVRLPLRSILTALPLQSPLS